MVLDWDQWYLDFEPYFRDATLFSCDSHKPSGDIFFQVRSLMSPDGPQNVIGKLFGQQPDNSLPTE
jgi:hypothetical protein